MIRRLSQSSRLVCANKLEATSNPLLPSPWVRRARCNYLSHQPQHTKSCIWTQVAWWRWSLKPGSQKGGAGKMPISKGRWFLQAPKLLIRLGLKWQVERNGWFTLPPFDAMGPGTSIMWKNVWTTDNWNYWYWGLPVYWVILKKLLSLGIPGICVQRIKKFWHFSHDSSGNTPTLPLFS